MSVYLKNSATKTEKLNKYDKIGDLRFKNYHEKKYSSSIDNDSFVSNKASYVAFLKKYISKETIDYAIKNNPNITAILSEYGLSTEYNIENVNSLIMSHLIPCANLVKRMYKNMGHDEFDQNCIELVQAALLHDIGKVFIPLKILNKTGKLTKTERDIIELHNKLSYEILKMTDLSQNVVDLTLQHHNYDGCLNRTPENQALTIADVYCALRERRPYKKPINSLCAKAILYDMASKGKFDITYIKYINK